MLVLRCMKIGCVVITIVSLVFYIILLEKMFRALFDGVQSLYSEQMPVKLAVL